MNILNSQMLQTYPLRCQHILSCDDILLFDCTARIRWLAGTCRHLWQMSGRQVTSVQ